MFKWVSIICSSITIVLLGIAGFALGLAKDQCLGSIRWYPFTPQCNMLLTVNTWAALSGIGLTVVLLIVHLSVAAKKGTWSWLITLLVGPPLCFFSYIFGFNSGVDGIMMGIVFTLVGLPNLLFSLLVLRPMRGISRDSLSAEIP